MNSSSCTRRSFLSRTATLAAAAAIGPPLFASTMEKSWVIGCLNRPWVKWSADEMLDGVKAAGYRTVGLQTPTAADPFIGKGASPEYLAALKQKIAVRGLELSVGRLRTPDALSPAAAAAEIRAQIDNARTLGLRVVINTGTAKPELYEGWYRMMALAAAIAADSGIQVVTKPHGGVTATAADIVRCLEKINHANFGIWYDAGNIIHYTGKDPLEELEPIIARVSAFTAKDCSGKGAEVMTQFGTGKVDFAAIFRRLKKAGFRGPITVESCAVGATAGETTTNAKANREFLERTLSAV